MNIFIVCGYGLPKDIRNDQNYTIYLQTAFNRMYDLASKQEATIIPCGGPTNCESPYAGTEAGAITERLREFIDRETFGETTSQWTIIPEEASLSALENLLFAQRILREQNLTGPVTIFCEKTREMKVGLFAERVFLNTEIHVHAIDFDGSKNRYLDPEIIQKKEGFSTKEGLWTLEHPERIQKHHELLQTKFDFLRKRQTEGLSHVEAVKEWIEREADVIRESMPDYPFFNERREA